METKDKYWQSTESMKYMAAKQATWAVSKLFHTLWPFKKIKYDDGHDVCTKADSRIFTFDQSIKAKYKFLVRYNNANKGIMWYLIRNNLTFLMFCIASYVSR